MWFILCESRSRRHVSEDLSQFDEEGMSWERKKKSGNCPAFTENTLTPSHISTHSGTQCTYAHTREEHTHTDTWALWFIQSCNLHFRLLPGLGLLDHGHQLSQADLNLVLTHWPKNFKSQENRFACKHNSSSSTACAAKAWKKKHQ